MTYLLQVSICWILFYGIYLLFLRKETFFTINRYYLLGSLVVGLVIPYIGALIPANNTSVEIYQVMSQLSMQDLEGATVVSPSEPMLSWTSALWVIYILGSLIVTVRFGYGLSKIYDIYDSAEKTRQSNYVLVQSDRFHLPFSFFHFIFISKGLPMSEEVEKVLKHEELHADQWHSLDIIFIEMLQVFFWFNPILVIYKAALRQSHEYLADAYVTQEHNKSSYGQLLLRQSTSGLEIALANQFFHSQIKKRITMMYTEKSKRTALVKYLAAVPVLVAMLLIFSSNRQAEPALPHDTDSTVEDGLDQSSELVEGSTQLFGLKPLMKSGDITWREGSDYTVDNNGKAEVLNTEMHNQPIDVTFPEQGDPIFKVVEEMPRFPGCEGQRESDDDRKECAQKKMLQYIYSNVKYPAEAQKDNIEGVTVIQFIVRKTGKITDAKIIRDIGGGCGEESLRVVNSFPDFIPGKQRGKKVNVQYVLPIKYKLMDDKPKADAMVHVVGYGKKDANATKSNLNKVIDEPHIACADVFKVVEQMPRFSGCEDHVEVAGKNIREECAIEKMLQFIYTNVRYPKEARSQGIEGVAVVNMIVDTDGAVKDARILRNPGGGTGEEAKRVVEMMPDWIPGRQKGNAVKVQYTLPIKFKLEGDDKEEKKGNAQDILKGKQSGVNIETGASDRKIVLRSTPKNADKQPLIVIDGKVSPDASVETVNPEDIAAINVVKGDKAIEKYGEQGENGVIEIKMKEGKAITKYLIDGQLFGHDFYSTIDKSHINKEGPASKEDKSMRGIKGDLISVNMLAGYGFNSAYFPGTNTAEGSDNALLTYVGNTVKYPQSAIDHEIEGLVTVRYTVSADGSLGNFEIGKSMGWGLDEVVLDMMEQLAEEKGAWRAAYLDRRSVASTMILPVKFKLNSEQKKDARSVKLEPIRFSLAPTASDGRFTVDYELAEDQAAALVFYDNTGRIIKRLDELPSEGRIDIDLTENATSMIYVSLQQSGQQKTIKATVFR